MTGRPTTGPTTGPNPATCPDPAAEPYSSPLPTPRPHLGHALASEWTKLISVRSTVWTLGSLVLLVVGVGLLAISQTRDENYNEMPFTTPAVFGLLVGQLSVMVLGVLTITSEHGTGLVRTTFTAAPDRHRVLTAKYLVSALACFTATAGSVFVVGVAAAIAHGGPAAGEHSGHEWISGLAGCVYVTLLGVLALAVGALVRHSAGAIAVMIGVVTLPPVVGGILSVWQATASLGTAVLQHNAPVALMQMFGMADNGGSGTETLPGNLSQMVLITLVTGAAVAASYVVVGRRDV
ncbi:ABC transporter permease [Streptomyces sp. NPDC006326]|uniref:ABC transporter permease n=1 Tax=Streptomyces sp. NPDC006326 TaxID=3156752 RepID=UPI0033AF501F